MSATPPAEPLPTDLISLGRGLDLFARVRAGGVALMQFLAPHLLALLARMLCLLALTLLGSRPRLCVQLLFS